MTAVNKEDWIGQFPRWTSADERQLIKLFYADVALEEIGKKLNRDGLQVTLRLIELRILDTDTLAKIWDDHHQTVKAA